MGKAFEKQIKTIENKGQKPVEALKNLKLKEQTKAVEGKSKNQSKATNIFKDLIEKRKRVMDELCKSVDMNKLYFKCEGNTKDIRFYEYMYSKKLVNKIKNNQTKLDDALKKQKDFLNKLNDIKIGRKTSEKEK